MWLKHIWLDLFWIINPNYRISDMTWELKLTCELQNTSGSSCPQVSDLSSKLREMRQYWTQLPVALCSKLAAGGAGQDKCWNGITKARWARKTGKNISDQSLALKLTSSPHTAQSNLTYCILAFKFPLYPDYVLDIIQLEYIYPQGYNLLSPLLPTQTFIHSGLSVLDFMCF